MGQIPIALQLYSVRDDCKKDFHGTLAALSQMGYEGVEFAGYYDVSASEIKQWLDDLGLQSAGSHVSIDSLRGDELSRTIEFNKTLENPYLIIPGLPADYYESEAKWREFVDEISQIAQRVKDADMYVGYHNHWAEFNSFGEKTLLQIYLEEAAPEVLMQFDTGNAMEGGSTVLPLLKEHFERAVTIHLKEYSATEDDPLVGEGDVDWQEVFKICGSSETTQWYIVEQESYAFPPMECVAKCLENLRKMKK